MIILGHRGASADAPENTLPAFALAMQQGAHGIELDCYQVDGAIVVIHDRRLERTTNGSGLVTEQSIAYLKTLDAGQGASIPLLDEVLAALPKHAIVNVEIKQLYNVELWLESLSAALQSSGFAAQNLIVSSFNHIWLRRIKQAWPALRLGALTASYAEDPVAFAVVLHAFSVHIALDVVDREIVTKTKAAGLMPWVFTVDHADDILMLADWGVEGIFCNKPEHALAVLHQRT